MEVHHHPEVEKKGFKEYVLEGLMIFLAVMMGFFAESIRENITNREHAEQLVMQLVRDVKGDTTYLKEIDSAESVILKKEDTLAVLLKQPLAAADSKNIQRLVVQSSSLWPFYPNTGAIASIKNELRLKQFSRTNIGNYIAKYEGRISILLKIEEIHHQNLGKYLEPFMRLHFTSDNLSAAFNGGAIANGQMRNLTQNDLTQLGVDLVLIKTMNMQLIIYNRRLRDQGHEMLKYVKEK